VTVEEVTDADALHDVLMRAASNRSVASTNMNSHSSRSHRYAAATTHPVLGLLALPNAIAVAKLLPRLSLVRIDRALLQLHDTELKHNIRVAQSGVSGVCVAVPVYLGELACSVMPVGLQSETAIAYNHTKLLPGSYNLEEGAVRHRSQSLLCAQGR